MSDQILDAIKKSINYELITEGEKLIQEHLKRIEVDMRKKLGECVIGLIESEFSVERFGADIRIIIRGGGNGR